MSEINLDALSALRNKGGYTSQALDMGVQWDFRMNCGIRKARPPVMAMGANTMAAWPERDFIPTDATKREGHFRSYKCSHSWRIGDYLSVCSKCLAQVPHGESVPAFGWKKTKIEIDEALSKKAMALKWHEQRRLRQERNEQREKEEKAKTQKFLDEMAKGAKERRERLERESARLRGITRKMEEDWSWYARMGCGVPHVVEGRFIRLL